MQFGLLSNSQHLRQHSLALDLSELLLPALKVDITMLSKTQGTRDLKEYMKNLKTKHGAGNNISGRPFELKKKIFVDNFLESPFLDVTKVNILELKLFHDEVKRSG